ncbi:fucose mutarotase-like isoform X3 [Gigantopelta aegis]|nr:fucose mutarotase-like isoform X3 [Gigantopelta aegis]
MKLLPLDAYVPAPVAVMELVDSDKAKNMPTPIWHTYQQIVDAAEGKNRDCTIWQYHSEEGNHRAIRLNTTDCSSLYCLRKCTGKIACCYLVLVVLCGGCRFPPSLNSTPPLIAPFVQFSYQNNHTCILSTK